MRNFAWKLELVSNISWMIVAPSNSQIYLSRFQHAHILYSTILYLHVFRNALSLYQNMKLFPPSFPSYLLRLKETSNPLLDFREISSPPSVYSSTLYSKPKVNAMVLFNFNEILPQTCWIIKINNFIECKLIRSFIRLIFFRPTNFVKNHCIKYARIQAFSHPYFPVYTRNYWSEEIHMPTNFVKWI